MAFGLLVLMIGIAWLIFSTQNQDPAQIFPATVNRDCAPWDGAAFTVSIPMSDGTIINISIWQSPDIKLPIMFSFPDETGRVGSALLLPPLGLPGQLTGKVFLWRVDRETAVEGEFDLLTEMGHRYKGNFKAEWGDEVAYCG